MNYTLCYYGTELCPIEDSDANWVGDVDGRKLTTGCVFLLNGGTMTLASKKPTCMALSIMEAGFVACSMAMQEAIWLKCFLHKLNVERYNLDPMFIHYDSVVALACVKDLKYHSKTKHIEVIYNFIRDLIVQKEVVLEHIPMSQMIVDPLTKPIAIESFMTHVRELGLCKWW